MADNFAQCREAARLAHEATVRNVESNPTRTVEWSSIAVAATSSEDTNTIPSLNIPAGRYPFASKSSDKSKGKDFAPPAPKTKRTRQRSEVEAPRKKTSQIPRPASILESDEIMALVE